MILVLRNVLGFLSIAYPAECIADSFLRDAA